MQSAALVASPAYTLESHKENIKRLYDGTLSLEEYRAGFHAVNENRDSLMSELSSMTKDQLVKGRFVSGWHKNEPKPKMVSLAFSGLQEDYLVTGGYTIEGFSGDWAAKRLEAITNRIMATTEDDLKKYAERVSKEIAEHKAKIAAAMDAISDPQTLDDFKSFLRVKTRADLTDEQKVRCDQLFADAAREVIAQRSENRAQVRAASQTTGTELIKTTHTKKGHDLYVVKTAERVERDVYNTWNAAAKKLGGYYSSYRGNGAIPGFTFTDEEAARAFMAVVTEGDTEKATELSKARRDAFADDKGQSAKERLLEMADALEARATDSLNQDRKANTARRARHAAAAEATARSDIALAKTMRNIAEGPVTYLDHVRTKVQVETLYSLLGDARRAEARAKAKTGEGAFGYDNRLYEQAMDAEPTDATAEYVSWPAYEGYRSDWARLARELSECDGAKQVGKALLKLADDQTKAYMKYVKENPSMRLTTNTGDLAVFDSQAKAEAVRRRSPSRDKLTVVPLKRGQNAVVWTPQAAKELGLWPGQEDERVVIPPDLAVDALDKAEANRVPYPYHWARLRTDRARLKAMWVETPAGLRAAMREFIRLRGAEPKADRIKELERALAGRKDIGIDFFPTPRSVAAELVERAGIEEGMTVLEPSTGNGNIADAIREAGFEPDVCEVSESLRLILEAKGYVVAGWDFLGFGGMNDDETYDRIIMNPPFSAKRDIEHVRHAFDVLKPGGRIVAIMCEGSFYRSDKVTTEFQEWLEALGADVEKLPEGTFLDPSLPNTTGVNARVVVIDKPE